jgi:hypothetical protein
MRTRVYGLACALAAFGCNASETGNPVAERTLALRGSLPSDDAGVTVDSVWIVLDDIRFEHGAECDNGEEREGDVPGPIVVDLVAEPAPFALALEDDAYCRVRVRFERADADLPSGAPAELEDAALVLLGTRSDGTPIVVRSRREPEAEVRSRSEPFQLSEATPALILAFDVGRWLEGVELDDAELDDDGVIRIDDDNNDDQLERFEANVEAAMELFHDRDDDGHVDDGDSSLATSE